MVEIKKIPQNDAEAQFATAGLAFGESCFAIAAKDGEAVIGLCLFRQTESEMVILHISPDGDFAMADGMLRSALFIAANAGITDVFWDGNVKDELIKRLGFVKNITNRSIDVTNLFSSCENCKN